MDQNMELCQHNQKGFCKFGRKCIKKHEDKVCENRNECTNIECSYRHPRLCKYFSRFGHCKFAEGCAYSHIMEKRSEKVAELEKELNELKEEMTKMKQAMSENMEKEVNDIKEDIRMLKEDVRELKTHSEI